MTPDYKAVSGYDTFIQTEFKRISEDEGKKYSAEDPGGLYNSTFGTSISYLFVGHKAYRNNIVKNFLGKNYIGVIESFRKYQEKLSESEFFKEVQMVYALSLMESGNVQDGSELLINIISQKSEYSSLAADSLFSFFEKKKDSDSIITAAEKYGTPTPYSMYSYVRVLSEKGEYKKVVEYFKANQQVADKDPRLYDYMLSSAYYIKDYDTVLAFKEKGNKTTYPMVADSLLSLKRYKEAEVIVKNMSDSPMKKLLEAKVFAAAGMIPQLSSRIGDITSDNDKSNLMLFYIESNFPEISADLILKFQFDSVIFGDYRNFYAGLALLMDNKPAEAVNLLATVNYEDKLVVLSYFYRGLAFAKADQRMSEFYLLKFIEDGADEERLLIARYMIAQFRFFEKKNNDALMLIQGCGLEPCSVLKAEIQLSEGDFENALKSVEGIENKRAGYIRAAARFNLKDYEYTVTELKKIENRDNDEELLLMKALFKSGDIEGAEKVYYRHQTSRTFLSAIVESLFLSGNYDKAIYLLERVKVLGPELLLLKAKALASKGNYYASEDIFLKLIKADFQPYESYFGYINQLAAQGRKDEFIKLADKIYLMDKKFDDIDLLYLQTARLALDLQERATATKMLNSFFNRFADSKHVVEAYLVRGRLFRDTGRVDQCVMEADRLISEKKALEPAYILKAECLEKKDPELSVSSYLELAKFNKDYEELANGKVLVVSTVPEKVLGAAEYFKEKDKAQYASGMRRFLSLVKKPELIHHKEMLDEFSNSEDRVLKAAGYYYTGVSLVESKNYFDAVKSFMKVFYIFPEDALADDAVLAAADSYKKLGKKTEAAKLYKQYKKIKGKK